MELDILVLMAAASDLLYASSRARLLSAICSVSLVSTPQITLYSVLRWTLRKDSSV